MGSMVRIQRKRTKGWKMPENTVYVGRPTKWGNPYKVGKSFIPTSEIILNPFNPKHEYVKDIEQCLNLYRERIKRDIEFGRLNLEELKGKNLACWCPLSCRCHADILIELINPQLT